MMLGVEHTQPKTVPTDGDVPREVISLLAQAAGLGEGFLNPACRHMPSSDNSWASYGPSNPHIMQAEEIVAMPNTALPLLLHPRAPASIYRRRQDEEKSVVHWGQRKLLMSEVAFLTMMGCSPTSRDLASSAEALDASQSSSRSVSRPDTVTHNAITNSLSTILSLGSADHARTACSCNTAWLLYAGAAPGTHISLLAALYPRVRFVLVDPAPFKCRDPHLPNVFIRQEFFSDEVAFEFRREWETHVLTASPCKQGCRPPALLFVSDIRTADWRIMSDVEVETVIARDMDAQQRWLHILRPLGSLLKFRLPWADGVTEYLAGAVALPVWGPPTTTESRLIVPSPALSRSMQVLREDGVSSSPAKLKMCAIIRAAVNTEVEHVAATRSAENRRSSDEEAAVSSGPTIIAKPLLYPTAHWDNTVYSEQLFYFNTDTRVRAYFHKCSDVYQQTAHRSYVDPAHNTKKRLRTVQQDAVSSNHQITGLDHCFDCSAEVAVLSALLGHVWPELDLHSDSAALAIRLLSENISSAMSPRSGRSLRTVVQQEDLCFPCHVFDPELKTRSRLDRVVLEAAFKEIRTDVASRV